MHGEQLESDIRLHDFLVATALYNDLVQPLIWHDRSASADLVAHPCFGVSAFLPASRTAHVPVSELRREQGDFRYWLYPAIENEPVVLVADEPSGIKRSRAHVSPRVTPRPVYDAALARLRDHGVPKALAGGAGSACGRLRTSR